MSGPEGRTPPSVPLAERRRLLARAPLFRAFPPPEIDRLAARAAERRFARGRTIFARGEPGSSMLVMAGGRVRVGVTSAEGREVLLAVLGPGEVLGELALLDGGPRSADATALDPCTLLSLDRRDLLPVLRGSPEATAGLFEVVCGRLRAANERLEAACLMPLGARLARLLLRLAAADGRLDGASLSQGDLARLVGASRQQVCLRLGRWVEEGVLARDRGVLRVRDRARLVALAGAEEDGDAGPARMSAACHAGDRSRTGAPVSPRP
jgi:CRP/FNR family transcriptional regulator, cyclic AMP receptor protein